MTDPDHWDRYFGAPAWLRRYWIGRASLAALDVIHSILEWIYYPLIVLPARGIWRSGVWLGRNKSWMGLYATVVFAGQVAAWVLLSIEPPKYRTPDYVTIWDVTNFLFLTYYVYRYAVTSGGRWWQRAGVIPLALSFTLYFFANHYWSLGTTANFSQSLGHGDALFFAVGIMTTAGTSPISATSGLAREWVTAQELLDLILLTGGVTLLLANLRLRISPTVQPMTVAQRPDLQAPDLPRSERPGAAPPTGVGDS